MARPTAAQKEAAFRSQNAAATAAAGCGGATGAVVFVPVAGPFIAAALGAVAAGLGVLAIRKGKIAHDPPRDDFRSSTEAEPSTLNPEALPDSPVREPAIGLITAADEAARFLAATVTALERASGAELAQDPAALEARMEEAYAFAERVATSLADSSRGSLQLADALRPYREVGTRAGLGLRARRAFGRSRLVDELPASVLPQMESVGIPGSVLRLPLRVTNDRFPVERAIADLELLAEADIAYAYYLQDATSSRTAFERGFPEGEDGPPQAQGGPPEVQGGPPIPA